MVFVPSPAARLSSYAPNRDGRQGFNAAAIVLLGDRGVPNPCGRCVGSACLSDRLSQLVLPLPQAGAVRPKRSNLARDNPVYHALRL